MDHGSDCNVNFIMKYPVLAPKCRAVAKGKRGAFHAMMAQKIWAVLHM